MYKGTASDDTRVSPVASNGKMRSSERHRLVRLHRSLTLPNGGCTDAHLGAYSQAGSRGTYVIAFTSSSSHMDDTPEREDGECAAFYYDANYTH